MRKTIAKALAMAMALSLVSAPSIVNANGNMYKLTVVNGTANPTTGDEGETSTITADVPEGYSFGDWEITGTTIYNSVTSPVAQVAFEKSDITATAGLIANTYNVAFNGNGATSGTMETQKLTYDKEEALQANAFVRDGYTFIGWNTKEDGSGTSYIDEETVKNLATSGTVTLYAQWGHYIVIENADGSVTIITPTVNTDGSFSIVESTIYTDGSEYRVETTYVGNAMAITISAIDPNNIVLRKESYSTNGTSSSQKTAVTYDNYYTNYAYSSNSTTTGSNTTYYATNPTATGINLTLNEVVTLLESYEIPTSITAHGYVYNVNQIGANAFKGNETIKKINVPGTITVIGKNAFRNMKVLKKATVGKKVKKIKANAFRGNKKMTKFTVKSSKLKNLGANVCRGNKKLKNISIKGKKLSTIGSYAFGGINKKATIKVNASKKKFNTIKKKIEKSKINKKVKIKRVS